MSEQEESHVEIMAHTKEMDVEAEHIAFCMPLNNLVGGLTDSNDRPLKEIMAVAVDNGLDPAFVRTNIAHWVKDGDLETWTRGATIMVRRLKPMTDEQCEAEDG